MFVNPAMGELVTITGSDPLLGSWEHKSFIPNALPWSLPSLDSSTYLAVADARAALAALDSTARQLPNPTLLRLPALRLEAQSTAELEGTYAPLAEVLVANEDAPGSAEMVEILNYVTMANYGFRRVAEGWPLTTGLIAELQAILMRGTPKQDKAGALRDTQVVIGRRPEARPTDLPVAAARFVPSPPGPQLESGLRDLLDWLRVDHGGLLDPVMVAGMAHYQFETLHPFTDGNGRVGRFLIVLQLLRSGVLTEPTLTVSPWFEARRTEYYDRLLAVSTTGDWDGFLRFFASGLGQAAIETREDILAIVRVQADLHDAVRSSTLRADTAHTVVDLAVANPTFTVRKVQTELGVSYGRANKVVGQLVDLGVLKVIDPNTYQRSFYAPEILQVLLRRAEMSRPG
jgi:Fic family protein